MLCIVACASPESGTYAFKNLTFTFPDGYETSDVVEDPSQDTGSLFIWEKDNHANKIEMSLSRMDSAFLDGIPTEEVFGEMVADVTELYQTVSSFQDIKIVGEPKVESDRSNKLPAEMFCRFKANVEDGSTLYCRISSKIVPPYSIRSISWAESEETLDVITCILQSGTIK